MGPLRGFACVFCCLGLSFSSQVAFADNPPAQAPASAQAGSSASQTSKAPKATSSGVYTSLKVPFYGAHESGRLSIAPSLLKPGQWIWDYKKADIGGPMAVVVNLSQRRLYVYRDGIRIGVSTISSGKKGKETPTGIFTVLQKDKDHKSNLYDSAPMPYMVRLTWDGIALHAGSVGSDSHGCIHLPTEFARLLYNNIRTGINVVVTRDTKAQQRVVDNGPISPVDVDTSSPVDFPGLDDGSPWRWQPDREPIGPLLVVLSRSDRKLFVYRRGQEIGRTPVGMDNDTTGGIQVYIVDRNYG